MKRLKFLNEIFRKNIILAAAVVFISGNVIEAQDVDYSGTSAGNFLKIGVGARPMAMGDAAIAVVNSADAMYWNPAGLTRMEDQMSVAISSMDWLVDTRNSYIAAAVNLGSFGVVGLDLQYLDYGEIEETTVYDQNGTGRFLSASDMSIGLAYAKSLTDRFSFGIKVKYIAETIANASAEAFAMDIGAVFLTTFFDNNLRLAASLSNFGTKMEFSGRDLSVVYTVPDNPSNKQIPADLSTIAWDLPLLFRFGISNYFLNNDQWTLLASYDILDSRDYNVRHNVGAEIGFQNIIYLRGGYKFNYDEVTYTVGAGLDFTKFVNYSVKLDYMFLDYGVFDNLNQFSLIINL